jgi:hypothetical protein
MRAMSVLVAATALASCSTAPEPVTRSPAKQAEFMQLVGGRIAQRPISCLPHYYANDMRVIDDNTVVFRNGTSTAYVAHLNCGCSGLGNGFTTLVTKQFGTADLCSGQIATVVDTTTHTLVGSCSFESFQPFVRPRA